MRTQKHLLLLSVAVLFICNSCQKHLYPDPSVYQCSLPFNDSSTRNPHHTRYNNLLTQVVQSGVPGMIMSISNPANGIWLGAAGKADLHSETPLQPCNITRMGSTVKTLTAVAILQLAEEGKLQLNDSAYKYLPASVISGIANADKATIRQLLNHSGGLYNYIQNPQFQTASLNDPAKTWHPNELLNYARNKAAYFPPGEDVKYSNTGYILLGMIIDSVTRRPFWEHFKEKIFLPAGMHNTLFAATNPVPGNIIRGYIDLYSRFQLTDATNYSGWDYFTADGGLISTVYDMNLFMQHLFSGRLINQASMQEMFTVISPKETDGSFFPSAYGLGIFKISTQWGEAWMHSGDAIGYFASMIYFPSTQTTIIWATNGNYGKIDELISGKKAMEKIFAVCF